jgi:hypothetical protein
MLQIFNRFAKFYHCFRFVTQLTARDVSWKGSCWNVYYTYCKLHHAGDLRRRLGNKFAAGISRATLNTAGGKLAGDQKGHNSGVQGPTELRMDKNAEAYSTNTDGRWLNCSGLHNITHSSH